MSRYHRKAFTLLRNASFSKQKNDDLTKRSVGGECNRPRVLYVNLNSNTEEAANISGVPWLSSTFDYNVLYAGCKTEGQCKSPPNQIKISITCGAFDHQSKK